MEFTVRIEVSRVSGKFASRDSIGEAIDEQVREIALDGLGADGDSEYQIDEVEVT